MRPLTDAQIRASFLNASRSERKNLTLPTDLDTRDWEALDYLGIRDSKLPKLASTMHAYPSYGLPIQSPLAKNVYYESLAGLAPLLKWVARLKIKIPF